MPDSPNQEARRLLTPEEFASLHKSSPIRLVLDTFILWATIAVVFALVARYPHPLVVFAAFVFLATRQQALGHLVHEGAHRHVAKGAWNDRLSDIFFAFPILISTQSYRAQHSLHHRFLGQVGKDTDQRAWYSITGIRFLKLTLRTLLGVEAFRTIQNYTQTKTNLRETLGKLLWQSLLFSYCLWLGIPWAFFLLWVLPLHTLTLWFLVLRVIAEHQDIQTGESQLSRTIYGNNPSRWMLGPFNFCFHHEHHLFPKIPYDKLPLAHHLLKDRGYYQNKATTLETSYAKILWKIVFRRRDHAHTLSRVPLHG